MLMVLDDFLHDSINHVGKTFFGDHLYNRAKLLSPLESSVWMSCIALANTDL